MDRLVTSSVNTNIQREHIKYYIPSCPVHVENNAYIAIEKLAQKNESK